RHHSADPDACRLGNVNGCIKAQRISESRSRLSKDTRHMPLRTRVRKEVARLSAKRDVAGAIERLVDPVAEELGSEVTNAPFAKQTRMLGITEQAPGDHRIRDDPSDPWHFPYRAGDATQRQ